MEQDAMANHSVPARHQATDRRVAEFLRPEFVSRHVLPLLAPLGAGDAGALEGFSAEIVKATPGRVTLRYALGGFGTIYGTAGEPHWDPSVVKPLQLLWQNGFGPPSKLQVVQPLGYAAEAGLLLTRQASGRPLLGLLNSAGWKEAAEGARTAARWLAQLHASKPGSLPEDVPCERVEVVELARLLGRVAASRPDAGRHLGRMLKRLRGSTPQSPTLPEPVPTHGHFSASHIYLNGHGAAVGAVDRICLSDPGRDIARFALKIRESGLAAGATKEETQGVLDAFLGQYQALAPQNLLNFSYFTALYCLKASAGLVGRAEQTQEKKSIAALARLYVDELVRCTGENPA